MKSKHLLRAFTTFGKRFLHTRPQENITQWIKPNGVETDIVVSNPVAKCKTRLVLNNKGFLTWYMCGPTLYDSAHIGHACTYLRFDIIKRILTDIFNIDVIQVMGLTDIDDKIIKKSNETKLEWQQITKHYENEFFEDMQKLNVIKPFISCRVTDYIPQIIEFVSNILKKDYAYIAASGSVYFNTSKYSNYGKLSVPIEDQFSDNPEKKSALDFALWKASKPGEPFWESPWGKGRPGWHIECSAIASTILGNNIDIHSGGIDLTFPHHENEEAQSCCYHNENQWINYWLHSGHLYLKNNEKMSKSLKNTIGIQSFLKDYSVNEFRLLCLMTDYKSGIEYHDVVMQNAVTKMKQIEHFLQSCNDYVSGKLNKGIIDEVVLLSALDKTKTNVLNHLRNDFNTGTAMVEIIKLIGVVNKMFQKTETQVSARSSVAVAAVATYVSTILTKLGITHLESVQGNEQKLTGIVETFVNFRSLVRNKSLSQKEKDVELLKACDSARKDLSIYGVDVKDYKQTSTWTYVNNKDK